MRLSSLLIVNYANINQFSYENQWSIRAGEPNTMYFQLIDLDQNNLRYLPGLGSQNQPYAVTIKFPSIDDSMIIQANAIQADANDNSVWKVSISSSQIPKSGNVIFTVIEGTTQRTFKIMNGLLVEFPGNDGSC